MSHALLLLHGSMSTESRPERFPIANGQVMESVHDIGNHLRGQAGVNSDPEHLTHDEIGIG